MSRASSRQALVQALLVHARSKGAVNDQDARELIRRAMGALDQFSNDWEAQARREIRRLERVVEGLDRALAALISTWSFHDDDDVPFRTEEEAFEWLQNSRDAGDHDPSSYLDFNNDWQIRTVWELRKHTECALLNVHYWLDETKNCFPQDADEKSRLPETVQTLIVSLCWAWHDHVDPSLGLPRRDSRPDNPLLRFLDACLEADIGVHRPSKKTVLHFVSRRVKPRIKEEAAEDRQFESDEATSQAIRDAVNRDLEADAERGGPKPLFKVH